MEPKGIIFTPGREQAIKQSPFSDKKRGEATKAKRHPQTRRFMFMRAEHDQRGLYDGPVNPEKLETKDWEGVTRFVKESARKMGADLVGIAPVDRFDFVRGTEPPQGHNRGISFAIHMDFDEMKRLGPLSQTGLPSLFRGLRRLQGLSNRMPRERSDRICASV